MNRPAGVQPIRGLFGGQPGQQSRQNQENRTPLGASRLQNGSKAPGNTSGWAFGPSNGIPGLPTPQTRPVVGASSFAQTIGSGQQQQQQQQGAPLDPSEFPSLSGAPQASFQNIGQAWAQQRAAQSTPVQSAPSAQPPSLSSQQQIHQAQDQVQQTLEDTMFGAGNMGSGADTFRNGHQADGQPQPGSHDEFPPLGQMGSGDISQDRRINMMQNAASGGFPSIAGFAPTPTQRQGIDSSRLGQDRDGMRSRQSFSAMNETQGAIGQLRPAAAAVANANASRPNDEPSSPTDDGSASRNADSNSSEMDKWGLGELIGRIRSREPEVVSMAIGHDLTGLGLDLSSTEPLHPTWAGPFATASLRPPTPDFTIPNCYRVHNVRPLREKLDSFNVESLFLVFYQHAKDVEQMYAAAALTARGWRYHKLHRLWFSRSASGPAPVAVGPGAERGQYDVYNFPQMRKEPREMFVRYADLDDQFENPPGPLPLPNL